MLKMRSYQELTWDLNILIRNQLQCRLTAEGDILRFYFLMSRRWKVKGNKQSPFSIHLISGYLVNADKVIQ